MAFTARCHPHAALAYVGCQVLLISIFFLADHQVSDQSDAFLRACSDNSCHASLAALLWICVRVLEGREGRGKEPSSGMMTSSCVLEICLSMLVGSLVDIDHFVAAGRFSLHAATHLTRRPAGHNLLCCGLLPAAPWSCNWCKVVYCLTRRLRICVIVFSAYLAHLLRDSVRRGLTLWPLVDGTAHPLPLAAIFAMYFVLPLLLVQLVAARAKSDAVEASVEVEIVTLGDIQTPAPGDYEIKDPSYRSPYRIPRSDHLSFGSGKTRFTEKQASPYFLLPLAQGLEVLSVFETMDSSIQQLLRQGCGRFLASWTTLFGRVSREGAWHSTVMLLQNLRRRDLQLDLVEHLGMASNACERDGEWQRSLQFLRNIEEMRVALRRRFHGTWRLEERGPAARRPQATDAGDQKQRLLNHLARTDQPELCRGAALALQGNFTLIPKEYRQIICAYGQVLCWKEALSVLEEMRAKGHCPALEHFAGAMMACDKAKQLKKILILLQEMQKSSILPDLMSYTALLSSSAKEKQWELALSTWCHMEFVDLVACSKVMSACAKAGKWWTTLALLRSLEERRLMPDEVIIGIALESLEKARKWQKALALLRSLEPPMSSPEPPKDFLGMTAEEWDELQSPWAEREEEDISDSEMEEQWQQFRALHQIGDERKADQELIETVDFLSDVPAAECIADVKVNHIMYGSAVSALCRGFQVDRAMQLLEETEMRHRGHQLSLHLFSAVASGCADLQRWAQALELLERSGELDVPFLNGIMWAMGRAGHWQRALDFRRLLRYEALRPTTVTLNILLTSAIEARASPFACQKLLDEMLPSRSRLQMANRECSPDKVTVGLLGQMRCLRLAEVFADFQPFDGPAPGDYKIPSKRHIQGGAGLKDKRKPMLVGSTTSSVGPGSYGGSTETMLLKKTYNVTTQARSSVA
eukprot:s86_g13.t4